MPRGSFKIQVQGHDEMRITRVRAPALLNTFRSNWRYGFVLRPIRTTVPNASKIAVLLSVAPTIVVTSYSLSLASEPPVR